MLGSLADAEDAVQDARLRLMERAADRAGADLSNPDAYLMRTVTNGCIDRLRARQRERTDYAGPWLPEPLVAPEGSEPEQRWAGGAQLSLAWLHLLERLTPEERALYVLRHGFDYRFAEIAELLGINAATARQRHHRAREKLGDELSSVTPAPAQRALLEALGDRLAAADAAGVVALLTDDAVALTDGGGVVSAAIVPVEGPARIAQVGVHLFRKSSADTGQARVARVSVNGEPGLCVFEGGKVSTVLTIALRGERCQRIFAIRNPHKLARVAVAQSG